MYTVPTSIVVGDREYKIRNNGDYRVILDCFLALSDVNVSKS